MNPSDKVESHTGFCTERGVTDQSLVGERDETDRTLSRSRGHVETKMNETLRIERQAADVEKTRSRKAQPGDASAELVAEKDRADKAVTQERSRVDLAIAHERKLNQDVIEDVIGVERAKTDHSLLEERGCVDTEVLRVVNLLSDEVGSHKITKTALTTRDEFLAIVSHDLRNPIGAIFSCAEMLLEKEPSGNSATETKYWLEFIKRNASSALRLINDILDIERIAEGKLRLQLARHSLAAVTRETIETFVYSASSKNILLRLRPGATDELACCDRDRVAQVLSNLIGNSIKFTPEGGLITLDCSVQSEEIVVSVHDTGPGIPEDKRKSIFDRFAQIGSPDRKGLGLGLYISKMLIEAHDGKIWVRSDGERGSTFCVALPRHGPCGHA